MEYTNQRRELRFLNRVQRAQTTEGKIIQIIYFFRLYFKSNYFRKGVKMDWEILFAIHIADEDSYPELQNSQK